MTSKQRINRTYGVLAMLLLALGASLPAQGPFSAQIQRAFQAIGLWGYDGSYTTGDFPVWNVTANKFQASSGAGSLFLIPGSNCVAPALALAGTPTTGIAFASTPTITLCMGGSSILIASATGVNISGLLSFSTDTFLLRDQAANILGQRSGTTAQRFNVYNSFTSATSYETFSADWQTSAGFALVGTRTGSAGGTARGFLLLSQLAGAADSYGGIGIHRSATLWGGASIPAFVGMGLFTANGTTALASGATGSALATVVGTWTGTSGTSYGLAVLPTYNEASGTAGNTDLLINRTETAIGSGTQLLFDAQLAGVSAFNISRAGSVSYTGNFSSNGAGNYFSLNGDTTGGSTTSGNAATAIRKAKRIAAIANAVATDVFTVTVPNASHMAMVRVALAGSLGAGGAIGAGEATGVISYDFAVTRTAGVATVVGASAAYGSSTAIVAGAATITITAAASAITGAVGATQTFTIQVNIARGSGASTNHTVRATVEVINANATGITVV